MTRYRQKPIEVEAIHLKSWGSDQWDEVAEFLGLNPNSGRGEHATMRRPPVTRPGFVEVDLHAIGTISARCDDWIVRGVKGEYWSCSPDVFQASYELAE